MPKSTLVIFLTAALILETSPSPASLAPIDDSTNNVIEEVIGGDVGDWIGDILEPFEDLIDQLINLPSQLDGWWDTLLTTVIGESDPCSFEGGTPPIVYEPDWCVGGRGSVSNPSNPDPTNSDPTNPNPSNSSMGTILADSQGAAGIPVPTQVRSKVRQAAEATTSADIYDSNPVVIAHYRHNLAERSMTRLASEGVLGEMGQAKLKQELNGIQSAATQSAAAATSAQGLNVTQDVMKQQAQITAHHSALLGSIAVDSKQQRIDTALSNLNLTNISRSLDEQNRTRRVDRTLAASKLLQTASQLELY